MFQGASMINTELLTHKIEYQSITHEILFPNPFSHWIYATNVDVNIQLKVKDFKLYIEYNHEWLMHSIFDVHKVIRVYHPEGIKSWPVKKILYRND